MTIINITDYYTTIDPITTRRNIIGATTFTTTNNNHYISGPASPGRYAGPVATG